MDSPSLELIHDCHLYTSGEVVVHPSAAIAPGVLLQADPDCRLVIEAGVCIGRGSILHASGGTLELQAGATLGAGVLIVGSGTIGSEACIGGMTTILNSSVLPKQSIAPGSLIGDFSRPVALEAASPEPVDSSAPAPASPESEVTTAPANPDPNGSAPATPPQPATLKTMTQVYGQAYVERIMITMFPHRRLLEPVESEPPPPT